MLHRAFTWLRREFHSRRDPVGFARSLGVKVGEGCLFLGTTPETWGTEPYLISLGDRVTVTAGVRFLTHDGAVLLFRDQNPDLDRFGPITVENNVFLGVNSLVLLGVTICTGSIVAAGAVVAKDVPPGSVVGGVPARELGKSADYLEKHRDSLLQTGRMAPDQKKAALLARFSGKLGKTS